MAAMVDVTVAVVALLKANVDVAALVGTRVFGAELPEGEAENMPRKCIVLQSAAGGFGALMRTYSKTANSRIDMRCYGETPFEAMKLYRTAHPVLKHLRRTVQGDVLIHAITPSIEASSLREPETLWPLAWASYNVLAAEEAHA